MLPMRSMAAFDDAGGDTDFRVGTADVGRMTVDATSRSPRDGLLETSRAVGRRPL
jgi:hypothetical protein